MVGHGGSSAGSYLANPTSPIPSHCASIVVTSTLRVKRVASLTFLFPWCYANVQLMNTKQALSISQQTNFQQPVSFEFLTARFARHVASNDTLYAVIMLRLFTSFVKLRERYKYQTAEPAVMSFEQTNSRTVYSFLSEYLHDLIAHWTVWKCAR